MCLASESGERTHSSSDIPVCLQSRALRASTQFNSIMLITGYVRRGSGVAVAAYVNKDDVCNAVLRWAVVGGQALCILGPSLYEQLSHSSHEEPSWIKKHQCLSLVTSNRYYGRGELGSQPRIYD